MARPPHSWSGPSDYPLGSYGMASTGGGRGGATVRLLSRALLALGLTALAAVIVRVRGSGGTPPNRGGWRELSVTDLEPPAQS